MVWAESHALCADVAVTVAVNPTHSAGTDLLDYRVTAGHSHGPPAAFDAQRNAYQTYYVLAGETPVLVHNCNTAPTDLHAFGNASGPRAPREGIDFHVGDDGMVIPQSGPAPHGASTFGDPAHAPLTGPYHRIPAGTELPEGFGVIADGIDVLPGSVHPPTHHTISRRAR